MKHKIVIYTSSHLRTTPETVCIANAISKALGDLGIEHRELNNTNDYWCRDYMPIQLSNDGIYACRSSSLLPHNITQSGK